MSDDPLITYAQPGRITDLGQSPFALNDLPTDIESLCRVVQGVLVHGFWTRVYGLSDEGIKPRLGEVSTRSAAGMLARIHALDPRPLTEPRPIERRMLGNCRTFSVLLTALLRYQGVPARARCGFGTYFIDDHYEDHWIVEWWDAEAGCWRATDAQIDDIQRARLNIDFDLLNVPRTRFLPGGLAWQQCRAGKADPETFGIQDMAGLWFVRGNVVRDLAALNRVELLPWDSWGLIDAEGVEEDPAAMALLDRAAALTLDDSAFTEMQALYAAEPGLSVPSTIRAYGPDGAQEVDLEAVLASEVAT